MAGIKVIKSFTTEKHEINKFENEVEKSFWLSMKEVQIDATQKPLIELVQGVAVVLVIWYGAYQVVSGSLSVSSLIAFFVGIGILATPISSLGKLITTIYRSLAPAERVFEILDTKPTISDAPDAVELPEDKRRRRIKVGLISATT